MDIVHQDVKQGKVLPLRFPLEALVALRLLFFVAIGVVPQLPSRLLLALVRLKPGRKNVRTEPNLSRDVECKLDDLGLGFNVEVDAVGTGDADEQVGEVGREDICFNKGIVLALDQRAEEVYGLLDDV